MYTQKGISLIELTAFIAIVGFFSVATLNLFHQAGDDVNQPLLDSLLIQRAQEKIDKMRFLDYQKIPLGENRETITHNALELLVNVSYAGEIFSLKPNAVKYITVTASNDYNKSLTLSVYRFDF